MTNEQLQALGIDQKWLKPLNDTFAKYNLAGYVKKRSYTN